MEGLAPISLKFIFSMENFAFLKLEGEIVFTRTPWVPNQGLKKTRKAILSMTRTLLFQYTE